MGFEIIVKTGKEGRVTIRSDKDGVIEFCKPVKTKQGMIQVPYEWYASIESAFMRILNLRVCNADATSIKELIDNLRHIRKELKEELNK